MLTVEYQINLTVVNQLDGTGHTYNKIFTHLLDLPDQQLYDNYHIIESGTYIMDYFNSDIDALVSSENIDRSSLEVDSFEINSLNSFADVYFESEDPESNISLNPIIKCYVHPKYGDLQPSELKGVAYDDTTIIWEWEDDGNCHYLITQPLNFDDPDFDNSDLIIADLPVGVTHYTETGLEPDTAYTRRIISYNANQTSMPTNAVTVRTETATADIPMSKYNTEKEYYKQDFAYQDDDISTSIHTKSVLDDEADDTEREYIDEKLEAFHSGVGDFNDLKVYKQMDADFYQKFKAYFEIIGQRIEREKRYDSVGFNYKVCLEGIENIAEQEGEVTFDAFAYPIENISIKDYMYATRPVKVFSKLHADVLLRRQVPGDHSTSVTTKKPVWRKKYVRVDHEWERYYEHHEEGTPGQTEVGTCTVIISLDISGSQKDNGTDGNMKQAALSFIDWCESEYPGKMHYVCVGWALSAVVSGRMDAGSAKNWISSIVVRTSHDGESSTPSGSVNNRATDFQVGLTAGLDAAGDSDDVIGTIMFTDGFCNHVPGDGDKDLYMYSAGSSHPCIMQRRNALVSSEGLVNSISSGCSAAHDGGKRKLAILVGCNTGDTDDYRNSCQLGNKHNAMVNANNVVSNHCKGIRDSGGMTDYQESVGYSDHAIFERMKTALKSMMEYTTPSTPGRTWYTKDPDPNSEEVSPVYWKDGTPGHYIGPADGKKWGEDDGKTDWGDVDHHMAFDGFEFDHWENDDTYVLDANFTIDECKWASVVVPSEGKDPFWFVFDEQKTPVIYNRNEQRAVIPTESIIDDYNFNGIHDSILQDPEHLADGSKAIMWRTKDGTDYQVENLYDEVMESVQEHELWNLSNNPYRLTISTAEGYKLFLVSGVWIEDTYKVADEDDPIDFDEVVQERNYLGSVNVYAKLNRMETDEFGDDVYFVRSTDALWVSGYTDGIIFDGTRYVSTKLNAYKRPKETILDSLSVTDTTIGGHYNSFMWNRKNSSIQYKEDPNNSRNVTHVVDLLEIDTDIEFTGHTKLFAPGDWELFPAPLSTDLVAENNRWYSSPILNYRFNLEDPDAKTQLYEIMPDADPECIYHHIVIVHIYYARNINVGDENTPTGTAYIASFGTNNIATTSSPFMWNNPLKTGANFWNEDNPKTIDSMIWFYASPMNKEVEYYDEIPNNAMESLYGMVNGRYKKNNPSGRYNLRVDTPKFLIPNTVDSQVDPTTIRIYISIRECYPKDALVQYKWDHPWTESNSVTLVNGDYVTFSSDSVTIKDVIYKDLIGTINFDTIELSEQGNYEHIFPIEKPITTRDNYTNYLLNVRTDNSDVIAMNYPLEIIFDDNNYAEVGVTFKGVVNATTQWAPRIHNGYYYINEQEYHAYSEFDVEANFEELEEKNFKNISGYLEIDVDLVHKAGDPEFYTIRKNSRSELLQNEEEFMWYPGQGLGLKPYIDSKYYKEYLTYTYYSPILYFPNVLSSPGPIEVEYDYTDNSSYVPMFVRSYILEEGKWSDWEVWENNTIPTQVPNSCAYQIKFDMQASTQNEELELEDYMCCYLDWKDDQDEQFCTNIVTVTDSLRTGVDSGNGTYTSKILDFGCETEINLDIYGTDGCLLYGAADNDAAKLQMSNITFEELPGFGHTLKGRYLRYRIVVPQGAKCFWLHKKFLTKKTTVIMPMLSEIKMTGTYEPKLIEESFVNIESFNIPTDNEEHQVFDSVYNIIAEDVHSRGFVDSEIKKVTLKCNSSNIDIIYNSAIEHEYPVAPGLNKLNKPVKAKGPLQMDSIIKYTPFIFAERNTASDFDEIIIKGTPQQYCPITVEDINEMPFTRVYDVDPFDMIYKENHYFIDRKERPDASIPEDDVDHDLHYIKLHRNDFDPKTLEVFLNDYKCDEEDYHIVNNLIIWDTLPKYGDHVLIQYKIKNSFYAEVVYEDKDNPAKENTTTITIYTDYDSEIARHDSGKWTYREDKEDWVNFEMRYKVFFETNNRNNKFVAEKLSLNPIYRTDYKGFIYLTDEHNEPYKINIYCNPLCLKAGGYDKVDISFEVLDINNNPVIEKQIDIDCSHGILKFDDEPSVIHRTDMNGVVHIVYESAATPCTDIIRARVLGKLLNPEKGIYEDTEISNSIEIVNEA